MMAHLDHDSDSEVSALFQHQPIVTAQRTNVGSFLPSLPASLVQPNIVKPSTGSSNTTQYIIEMDRSDEEESDTLHDPYATTRGRVSPSPYTANTERARQFNAYVRSIIEQKLDIFVPISHQPREIVSDIIADVSTKFPEFASCARKRIRTFLKSYRRSKKLKEGGTGNGTSPPNGLQLDDDDLPHHHSSLHHGLHHHTPHPHSNSSSSDIQTSNPSTAVVTIIADPPAPPPLPPSQPTTDSLMPDAKRPKLTPSLPAIGSKPPPTIIAGLMGTCTGNGGISHNNSQGLSRSEVDAVKQLITGYRESAAFLQRAADQLEAMLHNSQSA